MPSSREHHRTPARAKEGKPAPGRKEELQNRLLELLSIGRLVITPQWNHPASDWVTSVCADDIDDDGDIEIIAGSRDGYVRVLTRQGIRRWEKSIGQGHWITTIALIPSTTSSKFSPRIIAGTRDGKLYAFDQQGNQLADWSYQTEQGQVIHQIYVHHAHPDEIIVGAEDRQICLLDSDTGACRWCYGIKGRVLSVYAADIDGDGDEEILASATDKQIYILSRQGELKSTIKLAYKSYILAATEMVEDDTRDQQATIFASYNGKDLRGWTTLRHAHSSGNGANGALTSRTWPPHVHGNQQVAITFQRRPQAIHIADINNDGQPEILVGSTDHFLYILDHLGQLLWKHDCKQSIYSICTRD
ncbi:MAG TPA: WD40 repeat domain-containing protein, partial [Ktedonobacteraceae bacterium]